MDNVYEYIDELGNKKILDILSIFTIDGYDGKYAIASCDEEDEILSYEVKEEKDKMRFIAIKNDEIKKIIQDMMDMLLR